MLFSGGQHSAALFDRDMSHIPSALIHVKSIATSSIYGDVSWKDDCNIICCMEDKVEIRDLNLCLIRSIAIPGKVFKFKFEGDNDFYYNVHHDGKYWAYDGTEDQPRKVIFGDGIDSGYQDVDMTYEKISDSRRWLLNDTELQSTWHQFQIFDTKTPSRMCNYLSFDRALHTSREDGTIILGQGIPPKFAQVKEVWKCKDLQQPTGVTSNSNGLIFVACGTGQRIFLIDNQGKIRPNTDYFICNL